MVRIKNDFVDEQQIIATAFNDGDREVFIFLKTGQTLIYGKEYKTGAIPRQRVISDEEYEKLKDYFAIDRQARTII